MNEGFTIDFRREGEMLGISALSEDGATFGHETDASPLRFGVAFDPIDVGTKFLMKNLLHDNELSIFPLRASLADGRLRLDNLSRFAMPEGRYRLQVSVGGLRLKDADRDVEIRRGEVTPVVVEVARDEQRFEFQPDKIKPGDVTERVLNDARSVIDSRQVRDWLSTSGPRIARKACLLNLLAKLRTEPKVADSFAADLRSIFFCEVDRIYAAVDDRLKQRLEADPRFHKEGPPLHPTHRRLLRRIGEKFQPTAADRFTLRSYRIGEFKSLQIVVATPPNDLTDRTHYADIDIDLGNPLASLGALIVHIGELIDSRQTDHLKLFRDLDGIGDFRYYTLVKATARGA